MPNTTIFRAPVSGYYTITVNGQSTTTAVDSYFARAYREEQAWRGALMPEPEKRHPSKYKNKKRASGASLP